MSFVALMLLVKCWLLSAECLSVGFVSCFLMTGVRLSISGKHRSDTKLVSVHHIREHNVAVFLAVIETLIIWLRWYLPHFSTVKLLFFSPYN